jgi:hypothetical protein
VKKLRVQPSDPGEATGDKEKTSASDCYRWRGDEWCQRTCWRVVDEVNDRPVGKPQEEGMMNIAASFSLSKKPRFIEPVGKSQTQEGDAC